MLASGTDHWILRATARKAAWIVGLAPDCDSGCRGFESHQPPHKINDLANVTRDARTGYCKVSQYPLGLSLWDCSSIQYRCGTNFRISAEPFPRRRPPCIR